MLQALSSFSGVSVKDLGLAKEFYTKKLGLELENEDMGLMLKLPGGGKWFIYQKDDHQPATFTVLNLIVNDIDSAIDELTAAGITFERYDNMPAKQDEKGVLRGLAANMGPDIAWFTDPDGNILGLLQEER